MANNENLKPGNVHGQTPEEAQENGRKGGKQLGKNNKKKKDFQQKLLYAIEATTKEAIKKSKKKDIKDILGESGIIVYNLIQMAMNSKNPATKLAAIKEVIDRTEGKVKQKIENSGAITTKTVFIEKEEQDTYDSHIDDVIEGKGKGKESQD